MNKMSLLSYGLVLGVSVVLSGCGGGGGSSGPKSASSKPASSQGVSSSVSSPVESSSSSSVALSSSSSVEPSSSSAESSISSSVVVVTSSSLAESSVSSSSSFAPSSSSVSSSSVPTTTQLDIQGMAVAEALAGGEVSFVIGSHTYKTTIDDSLNYSVTLDVPNEDIYQPFTAIATGSGSDSWVQLAALYPSIAALAEKAGEDKTLTADEYFNVNITALTTAEYAEIINKELPIATDAQQRAAILSLHPTHALEQAAMVSRLLTDISISLPSQTETTLDYLLNTNLAETYLEALRIVDKPELNNLVSTIQQDASQVNVTAKKMVGKYFLEALYSQYLLTLNEDETGQLVTTSINTKSLTSVSSTETAISFTWTREGSIVKLKFDEPFSYQVNNVYDSLFNDGHGQWESCDDGLTSPVIEVCTLSFDSIQLEIIAEAEHRYLVNLKVDAEAVRESNSTVIAEAIESQLARVTKVVDTDVVSAADLIGAEWHGDKYNYVFSDDGKVTQTDVLTGIESISDWTLEANHVILDHSDLWLTHKTEGGFSLLYIDSNNIYRTSLFKRAAVDMQEADWVGRWSPVLLDAASAAYDVNEDKTWRDGFEAQSAGNWAVLTDHSQTALANGSWRMIRDVIAIHGNKYYLQICQGVEATLFAPSSCYLSIQQKAIGFDTAVFWKSWSNPAFNEKDTNSPLIGMWGFVYFEDEIPDYFAFRELAAVASNKLFSATQGTILEMTSANANEIELCEYLLNQQCDESNKHTYERGIEITLTIGAGGTVMNQVPVHHLDYQYTSMYGGEIDKVVIIPKGIARVFKITPKTGYELDTISGCDGVLVDSDYEVPARDTECEIVVNFTSTL